MFNALAWLIAQFYGFTRSYGVSIILLTITVRLILFPLTARQTRSMQNMQKVQPQVKLLQAQYKDDRQKLNEELMKFYKQNKINPAAGCLPLLLQMPIFFALYKVIYGLTSTRELSGLMIRVPHPKYLSADSELSKSLVDSGGRMMSFGVDLAQSASGFSGSTSGKIPYIVLVVLIAVTGYLQATLMARKQTTAVTGQAAQMQKIMKIMPVFFAMISFNIQAAVVIYWIAGNIWTIGQQEVLSRFFPATPAVVDAQATVVDTTATDTKAADKAIAKGSEKSAKASVAVPPAKAGKASVKLPAKAATKPAVTAPGKPAVKKQPTANTPASRGTAADTRKKK
jgi:YidC/Oxa1 family membrane protein insertase